MSGTLNLTAGKTVLHLILALAAFIVIALLASTAFLIPFEPVANIVNAGLQIGLTCIFVSLYCKRALRISLRDLRIRRPVLVPVWLVCAVALPALVSCFFLFFVSGNLQVVDLSFEQRTTTVTRSIFCICLSAGITEEIFFRGLIMKLVESKWGKLCAMTAPSIVFGLLHLINIEQPDASDILILLTAGTSVGIMFSAIAYKTGSVWPAAIVHGIWNLVIVGGILSIGTSHSENDIITYTLSGGETLLTGGAFGIEASLAAIIGYWVLIILAVFFPRKTNHHKL